MRDESEHVPHSFCSICSRFDQAILIDLSLLSRLSQTENPPEFRLFDPAASTFLPVGVKGAHFCAPLHHEAQRDELVADGVGRCGRRFGEAFQRRALGLAEGQEFEFFLVGHFGGLCPAYRGPRKLSGPPRCD